MVPRFAYLQAACDEGAEQRERAFILQLLGSASATSSREVYLLFPCFVYSWSCLEGKKPSLYYLLYLMFKA